MESAPPDTATSTLCLGRNNLCLEICSPTRCWNCDCISRQPNRDRFSGERRVDNRNSKNDQPGCIDCFRVELREWMARFLPNHPNQQRLDLCNYSTAHSAVRASEHRFTR